MRSRRPPKAPLLRSSTTSPGAVLDASQGTKSATVWAQQAKWEDADKLMDDYLSKNKGRKRIEQMATFHKAIVSIESKKDFDTALKLVDAAKAFDPSSEIGQQLDRIKKNIEKMRDDLKKGDGDEADGKKGEAKGGK